MVGLFVGNISYLSASAKQGGFTQSFYSRGWRPKFPENLASAHPELVQLMHDMWQDNFRLRPAMRDVVATLENAPPASSSGDIAGGDSATAGLSPSSTSSSLGTSRRLLQSKKEASAAAEMHSRSEKRFAVFLIHHKAACATEARLVKDRYESLLGVQCFLGKFGAPRTEINPNSTIASPWSSPLLVPLLYCRFLLKPLPVVRHGTKLTTPLHA